MGEPWHLRYLGVELAAAVYQSGLTYDEYYAREIDIPVKSADVSAIGVTTISDVYVNGNWYPLSTYSVLGETYFKLRDIAIILNGTAMTFELSWNSEAKKIEFIKGSSYTAELRLGSHEAGRAELLTAGTPGLLCGASTYNLTAYSIAGATFLKLNDILNILGIAATGDGTGPLCINTVIIPNVQPTASPSPSPEALLQPSK
jgi:hypothetical protein